MKMASRLKDLISKETNCTCSTLFLLVNKKQICTCSTLFCLSARLQRCFVRLKRQTSQLQVIFMEELSYVLTQYFVFCVHARFYFSLPPHFHLAGFAGTSISHFLTAGFNFQVFLPTKFVFFVFNTSLQLFLCYPRYCKHKK